MSSSYWKYKNSKSKQFVVSNQQQQPPKQTTHKWQYGKGQTKDKIKIASWNVNGIRSVYNRRFLEPYLQQNSIDILCVNQTKIDQIAFDKAPINLHGYSGYWNFCKCSSGYSGVAVFSKFLPISMEEDLPQPKHCHQGRIIILQFDKFYLVSVYVPNSGSKLDRLPYRVNEFDVDFMNHIQNLRKHKHVIIAGDFNVVRDEIDIYKSEGKIEMSQQMPACTLQQRNNFDKLIKLGYIDTFRELYPDKVQYTWWNMKIQARKRNIGWRIDYILINQEMREGLVDAFVRDKIMGSDHCPVQVCIDLSKIQDIVENEGLKGSKYLEQLNNKDLQKLLEQKSYLNGPLILQDQEDSNELLMMCTKLIEERQKNEVQKDSQKQKNEQILQKIDQKKYQQQNKDNYSEKKQKNEEQELKKNQEPEVREQGVYYNQSQLKNQKSQFQQKKDANNFNSNSEQELQKTQKKPIKREPIKFQSLFELQQLTRKSK